MIKGDFFKTRNDAMEEIIHSASTIDHKIRSLKLITLMCTSRSVQCTHWIMLESRHFSFCCS